MTNGETPFDPAATPTSGRCEENSRYRASESVQPLAELRTAMGDHVLVLVRLLVAMAAILGIVGVLGLVSAMA
jgi:hypothetical protein